MVLPDGPLTVYPFTPLTVAAVHVQLLMSSSHCAFVGRQ